MPRYYFNVRDGHELDEDDEGVELPDLETARAEAEATVEELRDELGAEGEGIQLEVADEEGRRLFTMALGPGGPGRRR